jgi:hypothetical protein
MGSEGGELTRTLTRRVAEARNGNASLTEDLVDRSVAIALARTPDERAWALTRMAAVLRRADRFDLALHLLDVADSLYPSEWPERAVFTCAIAVHCDRGDFRMAQTLGEEQFARSVDLKLFLAMARVYHALYRETEDPEYEGLWQGMRRRIDSAEAAESLEVKV